MRASYKKHELIFKRPSGTSRGVLNTKETWFILLQSDNNYGIGECGLLKGLSFDDVPNYEAKLKWVCENIYLGLEKLLEQLLDFPSIQFGLEQAFLSFSSNNSFELFPSNFTTKESPIEINGLIWMGSKEFMLEQIAEKLESGFSCIKMKIGAIDFDTEFALLSSIREKYSKDEIELRVDANGAFEAKEALSKLEQLSKLDLHSIEQPIKQGKWEMMKQLCNETPLPIALDEELIRITSLEVKSELLKTIQPQYIILKPSLVGGYKGSQEWIALAEQLNIGWWITSALESNIGLNAIAQWTYTMKNPLPQGLGTGSLFTNNFDSPLKVEQGNLYYGKDLSWQSDIKEKLCT
ncbi:o-succinylbenzoate synthase [Croceitalea sp. MTPC9]|uniref:o-succinylbenzoate synthase n=1 Tax=unclassified Croceitalea TaxID=2632280 RepID=UPI002B384BC1|nr:o-succinylbenzoate synthase [Croceitalea sp. MTPC6]GMN15891.1 o-succinylbenzoate synthase [Croceitalea sp. MTPC9]